LAGPTDISENCLTLSPPVALAPLAGITDLPFRRLVASFGAGLVVSEMVASQEVVQARPGTREKAELDLNGPQTAVQLAGRDPYWMAEAAKLVAGRGAQIIDINMGCPAKKVTSGYSGSALMRDLDHALTLIDAVVAAVNVPVTLKTRLGWDDAQLNAADLAQRAESAGVKRITVHGRTRCQFYKGHADWGAIRAVKSSVSIPVIANGDITDVPTAQRALALSKADGVMVGRGAQGKPWVLAQIAHGLGWGPSPVVPWGGALYDVIASHYRAVLTFYGTELGGRVFRKHLGWYLDTIGESTIVPAGLRRDMLTTKSSAQVLTLLRGICDEHENPGTRAA